MRTRRHIGIIAGAAALTVSIVGAHAGSAAAQTSTPHPTAAARYSFQTIASPHDKTFTQLLGINDHQVIAGYYGNGMTPQTPNKGVTLALPTHFMAENYPHAAQTQVIAINNWGDTAGFYVDKAGATHSFLDMGGTFTTVDMPGTPFNQMLGLNNGGVAAGYFQDAKGQDHAYVRNTHGTYTVPSIPNSQATGVNDQGVVVGFTQPTTTTASGFILRNDDVTTIDYPGSSFTQAFGENNQGQIVGAYNDNAGNAHGFVYHNGTFTSVDAPGASATTINGINNAGQIVGFFEDAHKNTVGFVGRPTS